MFHRSDVFEVLLFLLIIQLADGRKGLKNRPIPFQQQLATAGHTALQTGQETTNRIQRKISANPLFLLILVLYGKVTDTCNYFREIVMNSEEERRENVVEEEDEEKPFFKAAFDHFDWNHSSTIPTSVRVNQFTHLLFLPD